MEEINLSGERVLAIVLVVGLISGFGICNAITEGSVSALRREISELEHLITDLRLELEAQERVSSMRISSIGELLSNPALYHGEKVIVTGTVVSHKVTPEDPFFQLDSISSLIVTDADGNELSVIMIGWGEGMDSCEGFRAVIMGLFYVDPEGGNCVLHTHAFSVIVLD